MRKLTLIAVFLVCCSPSLVFGAERRIALKDEFITVDEVPIEFPQPAEKQVRPIQAMMCASCLGGYYCIDGAPGYCEFYGAGFNCVRFQDEQGRCRDCAVGGC